MPERSSISQSSQIGVEVTPGTAVACPRRLGSLGFEMGVQAEVSGRRPVGNKYATTQVLGKEWAEAGVSGAPVYTELPYLFASLLSAPTTQAVMDGATQTGATRWTFATSNFDADNPRTYTVEQGDSTRAHRVTNGLLTDLSLSWSREDLELEGTMLARRLEDGITKTPNPVMLPQVPVRPSELSVFLDTEHTALGSTKLTRAISGQFSLGSRFRPVWVVDAEQPSFVTHVEGEPEATSTLTQQANDEGMANLIRMRSGQTSFIRLRARGPIIYGEGATAIRHEMVLDFAGQVNEPNEFSDEDGIFACQWGFAAVFDPGWGHAMRAEVITTTSAL